MCWLKLKNVFQGNPKGVGFVRFDKKEQAEAAIAELDQSVPAGGTDPITVKFANNPSTPGQKNSPMLQSSQVKLDYFFVAKCKSVKFRDVPVNRNRKLG